MGKRGGREFRPSLDGLLEPRLLLASGRARIVGAIRAPRESGVRSTKLDRAIAAAFESFRTQYTTQRQVYFDAIAKGTATVAERDAFLDYTAQRVNLLGEQLTNSFSRHYVNFAAKKGQVSIVPAVNLVSRVINGRPLNQDSKQTFRTGSLGSALQTTTPPINASELTRSLVIETQSSAIRTAEIAMTSGIRGLRYQASIPKHG
jgi:hypothetical protein